MLDSPVLVLNKGFAALTLTDVKRTFTLFYKGHVRAVLPDYTTYAWDEWQDVPVQPEDDLVTTPNLVLKVPRVVQLLSCDRSPRHEVKFSRHNIYMRDGNTCQYCGHELPRAELNLDHVVPRAQGGRTTWENVVCCCIDCNLSKGARTPEQAGMKLLKIPVRPRWTPTFRTNGGKVRYREWLPFLGLADASYWNVELEDD
jgi:5-methylcytosine-specific restriction endonuclease McrA